MRLPVISYDLINGQEAGTLSSRARIAVINSIGEQHQALPFFALVSQGIPRLVKVQEEEIAEQEQDGGPADQMLVRVSGEEAAIPNLVYLAQQLTQLG